MQVKDISGVAPFAFPAVFVRILDTWLVLADFLGPSEPQTKKEASDENPTDEVENHLMKSLKNNLMQMKSLNSPMKMMDQKNNNLITDSTLLL